MSPVSKIPRREQQDKMDKCKIVNNNLSKTKCHSTAEDGKATENASTGRMSRNASTRVGNSGNVLPSSRVPVRLQSRTRGQSKSSSTIMAKENSNKNKAISINDSITKNAGSNSSINYRENGIDSSLSKKNSCRVKTNYVSQCNPAETTSQSQLRTSCPRKTDKEENKLNAKQTIQPKRTIPNKGILKDYCHNSDSFHMHHSSEDDLILDSKTKNFEMGRTSRPRKVTFKNLSSDDLTQNSEGNDSLMNSEHMDKSFTECELEKNESSSPTQNLVSLEKKESYSCNEEKNSRKLEESSSVSLDVINDKPMMSPEKLSDENVQDTARKLPDPSVSLIKTEHSETGSSTKKTVVKAPESIISIEEYRKQIVSDLNKEVDIFPLEQTTSEKPPGRRQSIQKQIDKKIEILTAEFLKYIKEKKRRIPRPIISKKDKSNEEIKSQEPCSEAKPDLQDMATSTKGNNEKSEKLRDIAYVSPSIMEMRGDNSLLDKDENYFPTSHHSTQGNGDIVIPSRSSRIPRCRNSKKESLSPLLPVNLNSDSKMPEQRKPLSPFTSQKVGGHEKTQRKCSQFHKQNLSKRETDKIASIVKEFDSLRNVLKCDLQEEELLQGKKRTNSQTNCQIKGSNSETLHIEETSKSSAKFQDTDECKDMDIPKISARGTNEQSRNKTTFKNNSGELKGKTEENVCLKPSDIISLEDDKRNRPYLSLENKTHQASYCSSEESGNENIFRYEDKENSESDSDTKLSSSQHKKKIFCFTLIFVFSSLLLMSMFL